MRQRWYEHFVFEITPYNNYIEPQIINENNENYLDNFNRLDSSADGDRFCSENNAGDTLPINTDTVLRNSI